MCVGFVVLVGVLVPFGLPLGWDEIVYASRFGPYGPGVAFSAPRTRGVPVLLAPVASWTDPVVLLRFWMTGLAGGALYLGFRPWVEVLRRPVGAALGAGMYGSLWFALFYANSAMPNHYTAMGALAATGCVLRRDPGRGAYAGIVGGLGVVTLMRPNDGAAVALPLFAAVLLVPAWRGRGRLLAVAAGVAVGALPWVVEAWLRFGGVARRLAEASDTQGGMRPVLSVEAHLTALDGPLLCRPCTDDTMAPGAAAWWLLLPLLVALGLWTTHRAGRPTAPLWLAVAVGACASLPYLFLVPYAAPRFLLPGYALLVLPAAVGLLALADRAGRSRPVAVALAVVVLGHTVVQIMHVRTHVSVQERARADWQRIGAVLREGGVRPPCLIKGNSLAIPVAYTAGCASAAMGDPAPATAVILRRADPPHWAREWLRRPVPGTYNPGWSVAVRPRRGSYTRAYAVERDR
ncbi:hypothetical protein GCM10011583_32360 [Streptomyces camponoticapitis]|uniref:Integral membrane protein n=1 Tax=Streptomyces camponoticapitis TaxID=1616125 RepID=A0ABQ2E9E1_9ACTN|nr:hypothetical protein GCM10011583_32360 [Streptomyces camponoticapitis]